MSLRSLLSSIALGALSLALLGLSRHAHAEPVAPAGSPAAVEQSRQPEPAEATEAAEATEDPAPARYRRVRTHQFGIAGGGAIAQGYTLSALIATGALLICAASTDGDQGCGMRPSPGAFRELFIPLAGPWLALRRDDVHGDTKYALLFGGLGAVQAAGVLLIAYDLAVPRYRLEPEAKVSVRAVADADTQLLVVEGRF